MTVSPRLLIAMFVVVGGLAFAVDGPAEHAGGNGAVATNANGAAATPPSAAPTSAPTHPREKEEDDALPPFAFPELATSGAPVPPVELGTVLRESRRLGQQGATRQGSDLAATGTILALAQLVAPAAGDDRRSLEQQHDRLVTRYGFLRTSLELSLHRWEKARDFFLTKQGMDEAKYDKILSTMKSMLRRLRRKTGNGDLSDIAFQGVNPGKKPIMLGDTKLGDEDTVDSVVEKMPKYRNVPTGREAAIAAERVREEYQLSAQALRQFLDGVDETLEPYLAARRQYRLDQLAQINKGLEESNKAREAFRAEMTVRYLKRKADDFRTTWFKITSNDDAKGGGGSN